MRYLLLAMLFGLTGCASAYQWVNLNDCSDKVEMEGDQLARCKKVRILK